MSTSAPADVTAPLVDVVDAARSHPDLASWMTIVTDNPRAARARVSDSIQPLLIAALNRSAMTPSGQGASTTLLAVTSSDAEAERLADAVGWYLGEGRSAAYLSRGVPYGSGLLPPPARVGSREHARVVAGEGGVVVASVASLLELVPAHGVRSASIEVRMGQLHDRDELVGALVSIGYERMEQAEERGQVAARGDIVDVFPTTARYPVRIELFDDEVDSIRQFSPYTQRSLGRLEELVIDPAGELTDALDGDMSWSESSGRDDGESADVVLDAASDRLEPAWQAFGTGLVVVVEAAGVQRELEEELVELDASHVARRGYVGDDVIARLLGDAVHLDQLQLGQQFSFDAQPPVFGAIGFAEAEAELAGLISRGLRAVVTFPHRGHLGRTHHQLRRVEAQLLSERVITPDPGAWLALSLAASGFVSRQLGLAVVPSGKLFRTRVTGSDEGAAARIGQAMAAFTSLRVGDFVVHEDHGIGRFAGFETKTVAGVTRDYLYLEYQGADRVYVPHEQMGKVTRYVGADGSAPTLSKLGGKRWHTLRNRARSAARELAGELIALYARRSRASGHAFPPDDELMTRFELSFPFQETEDQERAIAAVKEDLERPQPMDRLICGDVGFGKTEVAMRAAMKAVTGSRQVIVLVPTTVLAQQHLVSFRDRFADLPVTVDMVSRFRQPKDVKRVLEEFREGKVDILIGTHRILSRDVVPRDLGLVVVDEEQRFGVAQKELLRQLRLEVDVLSLSATPIPRTLHMSLAGIRDITVIETAPQGRRPIHTHVGEYDEEIVRMAIERELDRDGQVYYLHNRVETIDEAAARIQQVVPRARVRVGHGQMGERQLEDVMLGFLRRDYDVLVATTIIESGLDIPTANTLLVERADMLGLAQLYQIRGRVGRSSRSAHAYLFYPSARELTEEARARLTTLADFTDLGSGSRIAMRDLELRGAGNLLGGEQSGHVAAVGFELYVDMLGEAVAELSGEPVLEERGTLIDVKVDAYVPADYVASEAIKIDLHRRIALARDEERLDQILLEIADRFGEVPAPMVNLVTLARLRLLMIRVGAERLSIGQGRILVAQLKLSSNQVAYLKPDIPLMAYSEGRSELGLRYGEPDGAIELAVGMLRSLARVLGR